MRIINHNLSITYPSIGTSPHEFGLPVMSDRHPGNCTGLGSDIHLIFTSFHFICGGSFRHDPYDACLEGTHTKVHKLPVKPYPLSGIVGVLYNWNGIASEPNHQFLSKSPCYSSVIFTFKTFSRMTHHSMVFINIWFKCPHLEWSSLVLALATSHEGDLLVRGAN